MDERIIERLRELDVDDKAIVLISFLYDNGEITEEDIFDIGEDNEFNIENIDMYELADEPQDSYSADGIEFNGYGYYVFDNEDSARDVAIEEEKSIIDDVGIEGINWGYLGGIENFVDTEWFEDAYREMEENYCCDILSEGDNTYDNRLVAECYDEDLIDDDDFETDEDGEIDYTQCNVSDDELVERYTDLLMNRIVDYVDEYKSEFGEREFNDTVMERNLIDIDKLCEAIIDTDGIGNTLARYDGEDNEYDFEGNTWYLYRYE